MPLLGAIRGAISGDVLQRAVSFSFLPHPSRHVPTRAVARPVCNDDEPEGCRGRLELPYLILLLPVSLRPSIQVFASCPLFLVRGLGVEGCHACASLLG
jgi:hypothetical protein